MLSQSQSLAKTKIPIHQRTLAAEWASAAAAASVCCAAGTQGQKGIKKVLERELLRGRCLRAGGGGGGGRGAAAAAPRALSRKTCAAFTCSRAQPKKQRIPSIIFIISRRAINSPWRGFPFSRRGGGGGWRRGVRSPAGRPAAILWMSPRRDSQVYWRGMLAPTHPPHVASFPRASPKFLGRK